MRKGKTNTQRPLHAKGKPVGARGAGAVAARWRPPGWVMAGLLCLTTLAVFWPAMSHDFVYYDDNQYVFENTHITGGLTLESVRWALRTGYAANWHPLTWLSHALDCQLYGLKPWGHHFTSVWLHAINAALVFTLLRQMTGATVRSLCTAGLFALHPLRVESVAWVAERKDVLSGCLGLLTLIFYVRYAQVGSRGAGQVQRGGGRPSGLRPQSSGLRPDVSRAPVWTWYGLSVFSFACGLASKPMLVTGPFVMLLLDYWPLKRFQPGRAWRLLVEKVPFFALAFAVCVVTFLAQEHAGAMIATGKLPFGARAANALVSYCRYLGKLFWPTNLAVFYPHSGRWPTTNVALAGAVLLSISLLFLLKLRRQPYLLIGWLWFVGMLVPVIGLVQVGDQAMADRYTYLPSLGVLLLAVWGSCELTAGWRFQRVALSVGGSTAIVACVVLTRHQLEYWQDSEALFRHALEVTQNNYIAHCNLAESLTRQGHLDEAILHYQQAIQISPAYADAHNNLGNALSKKGQLDAAIGELREAIRLKPDTTEAYINLGSALLKKGDIPEAIVQLQKTIGLNPSVAEAHYNLGLALDKQERTDEALTQYQEAIRLRPDYAEARNNLGAILVKKGKTDEALIQYREAIRLKPEVAEAHYNLGAALEAKGLTEQAILEYQEALRLNPEDADARGSLARLMKSETLRR